MFNIENMAFLECSLFSDNPESGAVTAIRTSVNSDLARDEWFQRTFRTCKGFHKIYRDYMGLYWDYIGDYIQVCMEVSSSPWGYPIMVENGQSSRPGHLTCSCCGKKTCMFKPDEFCCNFPNSGLDECQGPKWLGSFKFLLLGENMRISLNL